MGYRMGKNIGDGIGAGLRDNDLAAISKLADNSPANVDNPPLSRQADMLLNLLTKPLHPDYRLCCAGVTCRGLKHQRQNKANQDALYTSSLAAGALMILGDGVDSCKHAAYGAQSLGPAIKQSCDSLTQSQAMPLFESIEPSLSSLQDLDIPTFLQQAYDSWRKHLQAQGLQGLDCKTTCQILWVYKQHLLVAKLGDGLIGVLTTINPPTGQVWDFDPPQTTPQAPVTSTASTDTQPKYQPGSHSTPQTSSQSSSQSGSQPGSQSAPQPKYQPNHQFNAHPGSQNHTHPTIHQASQSIKTCEHSPKTNVPGSNSTANLHSGSAPVPNSGTIPRPSFTSILSSTLRSSLSSGSGLSPASNSSSRLGTGMGPDSNSDISSALSSESDLRPGFNLNSDSNLSLGSDLSPGSNSGSSSNVDASAISNLGSTSSLNTGSNAYSDDISDLESAHSLDVSSNARMDLKAGTTQNEPWHIQLFMSPGQNLNEPCALGESAHLNHWQYQVFPLAQVQGVIACTDGVASKLEPKSLSSFIQRLIQDLTPFSPKDAAKQLKGMLLKWPDEFCDDDQTLLAVYPYVPRVRRKRPTEDRLDELEAVGLVDEFMWQQHVAVAATQHSFDTA